MSDLVFNRNQLSVVKDGMIHVNLDSIEEKEDGTLLFPFKSISAGVLGYTPNKILAIYPGIYIENVEIGELSAIYIQGMGNVILEGNLTISSGMDYVFIDGLDIQNLTNSSKSNVKVKNSTINSVTFPDTSSGNISFTNCEVINLNISRTNTEPQSVEIINCIFPRDTSLTVQDTYGDIYLSNCKDVNLRHLSGKVFVSNTSFVTTSKNDTFSIYSSCDLGNGELALFSGSTYNPDTKTHAPILKIGSCDYLLGNFLYDSSTIFEGNNLDVGITTDQIYDMTSRPSIGFVGGSLKDLLDRVIASSSSVPGAGLIPGENITISSEGVISAKDTTDYIALSNKPQIQGIVLEGNKPLSAFGIASQEELADSLSELSQELTILTGTTDSRFKDIKSYLDLINSNISLININLTEIDNDISSINGQITQINTKIDTKQDKLTPGENVTISLEGVISAKDTTDYNDLTGKPSINEVTLSGELTLSDLGIASTTDLGSLKTTVDGNTSGISLLNSSLDGLESTVGVNTSNISSLSSTVNSQGTAIESNTSEITSLKSTVDGISSSVEGNTVNISELNSSVETLTNKVGGIEEDVTGIFSDITSINSSISDLSTETQNSLALKQDKLTPGGNVTITPENIISTKDTTDYNELTNKPSINDVSLTGNLTAASLNLVTTEQFGIVESELSVNTTNISEVKNDFDRFKTETDNALLNKQDKLTPGENVTITAEGVVSASGITSYDDLTDLPAINGATLKSSSNAEDLGLATTAKLDEVNRQVVINTSDITGLKLTAEDLISFKPITGTEEFLTSQTEVFALGVHIYTEDSANLARYKIGDGVHTWAELEYEDDKIANKVIQQLNPTPSE